TGFLELAGFVRTRWILRVDRDLVVWQVGFEEDERVHVLVGVDDLERHHPGGRAGAVELDRLLGGGHGDGRTRVRRRRPPAARRRDDQCRGYEHTAAAYRSAQSGSERYAHAPTSSPLLRRRKRAGLSLREGPLHTKSSNVRHLCAKWHTWLILGGSTTNRLWLLTQLELFQGVRHEDAKRVADILTDRSFRAGEEIPLRPTGETVYIVKAGRARNRGRGRHPVRGPGRGVPHGDDVPSPPRGTDRSAAGSPAL